MPLRTHLLAIATIVMTVFTGWLLIRAMGGQAPEVQTPQNTVQIVRASWGLNCKSDPNVSGDYGDDTQENKENNYLEVARLNCKGVSACAFINSNEFVGSFLKKNCDNKELIIEYRCYSFDRLRQLKIGAGENGTIDCSQAKPPAATPAKPNTP